MDTDVWLSKTAHCVRTLVGFYGPTFSVSGEGGAVRVVWADRVSVEWRVLPGEGSVLADRLRKALEVRK